MNILIILKIYQIQDLLKVLCVQSVGKILSIIREMNYLNHLIKVILIKETI